MTEQRDRKAEKEAEEGGEAAQTQGEGEVKLRGGRRVKPKTDGQVRSLAADPMRPELMISLRIVRHEERVTLEVVVVVVTEAAVGSEVEAEEVEEEIEVVGVVEGAVEEDEVEEDEVDTVLAQAARSGSLQVRTLFLWDSIAQLASPFSDRHVVCTYLMQVIALYYSRSHTSNTHSTESRSGSVSRWLLIPTFRRLLTPSSSRLDECSKHNSLSLLHSYGFRRDHRRWGRLGRPSC